MANKKSEIFDYIIIGSRPVGYAIAQTLITNPKNDVMMFEAGEDKDNETKIMRQR